MTATLPPKPGSPAHKFFDEMRKIVLAYPEAREDFPWGHSAFKVKTKVFVFMGSNDDGYGISAKLPVSSRTALTLPFAKPAGYGLGKSGWVDFSFKHKERAPMDLLKGFVEESYRAVAPKKLVAVLDGDAPAATKKAPPKKKKSVKARG